MTEASGDEETGDGLVSGRRMVALFGVMIVIGYLSVGMPGMPGMGHGGSGETAGMSASSMALGVDAFARRVASPDAFVINVHARDAGSIDGTDAAIAYSEVARDDRLPTDLATPILLYCKTGRMSQQAATALMGTGYSDVRYLKGGADAWVAAGRPLR